MRKTDGRACAALVMKVTGERVNHHDVDFREDGFGIHVNGELIAGLAVSQWVAVWEDPLHIIPRAEEGCLHCEVAGQALAAQAARGES